MRIDRLRQMTAHELRWRTAVALRSTTQRMHASLRTPRWQRSQLTRVLAPPALGARVREMANARRWQDVHDALADRLRSRGSLFVLDPSNVTTLRAQVLAAHPGAVDDARRQADLLRGGEFDLLGYRSLRFDHHGKRIDWHYDPVHGRGAPRLFHSRVPYLDPAVGDHKIIWELNRHQYWLRYGRAAWLTGDVSYAHAILDELRDWLEANPPLVGINWASMLEVGFRAISWTWTLHALLALPDIQPATPWLVDLLIGIDRHLSHVEQNLSYYFSPNTHLTGEALALYVGGVALPELAGAARWAATGRRILLEEIERQILPDGGHAERSTHYQRYTLDFYLLALLTAQRAGDADAIARFTDAAGRLAQFTRTMASDDGRLPLIGDDDGGMLWPIAGRTCNDVRDSLSVAAIVLGRPELAAWPAPEEVAWIAGPEAFAAAREISHEGAGRVTSRVLESTGYVVSRDAHGGHAVFDVGRHGYLNAGHAHADALALALTLGGHPLLIDPGTSAYTIDAAVRDRMRSSASHNTVTLDDRSPSLPAGPFHWHSRTDATLHAWRQNDAFDWAEASHDGYAPLVHRRSLVHSAAGWLVTDEILGSGRHRADTHWHLDPAWVVDADRGWIEATRDAERAWILHEGPRADVFRGDRDTGLGWSAPVYGTLLPSPTARVTTDREAPFSMITWIGHGDRWRQPALSRLAIDGDRAGTTIAAQVVDGDRAAIYILDPGGAATTREYHSSDCRTDARVLHYTVLGARLLSIDLVDARLFVTHRRGWLSIEADEPSGDLHVEFLDHIVHLQASTPPPPLRLHGVTAAQRIRLNGRDLPHGNAMQLQTLLIHPTDWHYPDTNAGSTVVAGAGFADHSGATRR